MESIFASGIVGSVIAGAVLLGIVAIAVCSMISDKKKGKSLQCGGDCKHCGGHCGYYDRSQDLVRSSKKCL